MTKQQHASYLKQLDTMPTDMGATKGERSPGRPEYTIQTGYGPYTLSPVTDKHSGDWDLDVFGRFTGTAPFPAAANQFSGKMNFHFSRTTPIATALDYLEYRLNQIVVLPAVA